MDLRGKVESIYCALQETNAQYGSTIKHGREVLKFIGHSGFVLESSEP